MRREANPHAIELSVSWDEPEVKAIACGIENPEFTHGLR